MNHFVANCHHILSLVNLEVVNLARVTQVDGKVGNVLIIFRAEMGGLGVFDHAVVKTGDRDVDAAPGVLDAGQLGLSRFVFVDLEEVHLDTASRSSRLFGLRTHS